MALFASKWKIHLAGIVIMLIGLQFWSNVAFAQTGQVSGKGVAYINPALPLEVRVDDLVSRMTLEEKIGQMQYTAPAIPRLGIPEYNWWNECLHGVARNGIATVFPQAIGMAATWNPELIYKEADVISTEARAKYYEALKKNQHGIYQGLTFWSPNINIFRDPRWGRGQETYGEDPYLTSEIGKAFVKGLQGNHPKYLKVVSTAKHFAVHSGPESERHRFDAWPSLTDLYDTYLPAFEALVKDAGVASVMSCYNRVYGTPSSANTFLLEENLRKKWGFSGYVVSDCWAISDIYNFHKFVPTAEQASSLAVRAGVDLACGPEYGSLLKAIELGYLSERVIDQAVKRLFMARFKLGMFDPPMMVPYASITPGDNDTPEHRTLARKVARESIVLLKNENYVLPLKSKLKSILVVGPYADDTTVLLGNYNGIPSAPVTILQGIRNQVPEGCKLLFCRGVDKPETVIRRLAAMGDATPDTVGKRQLAEALSLAKSASVILFVGGISPELEGEEMDVKVPGFGGGDRTNLELPSSQQEFLEQLSLVGKPVIFVVTNGSALALNWANAHLPAIVEAWYPGEEGGNAVADVLFGKYNPSGKLPVTFYKSIDDLPAFDNYSMQGRTYRYFRKAPLYEFGYGLSYSSFELQSMNLADQSLSEKDTIQIRLTLKNTSRTDGEEVVQVYVRQPENCKDQPIKTLLAFQKVLIPAGNVQEVNFRIPASRLRHYDNTAGDYEVAKGSFTLMAGFSSEKIVQQSILKIE